MVQENKWPEVNMRYKRKQAGSDECLDSNE